MNRILKISYLLFMFAGSPLARSEDFEFKVQHHHTLKDCYGSLKITSEGVEFLTSHAKDSRKWKYEAIRTMEIKSPTEISIITYEDQKRLAGRDRIFEFKLLEGKATQELSSFLLARIKKPMLMAVLPEDGKPAFEIPVKHLRTITGAMGVLKVFPDKVVFQAAREGDSRFWRLSDIERFSQPDRFRFQIVSFVPIAGGPTEVYNFQLLEDLPEGVYDYLWIRLHPDSYSPAK